ncbi:MAG: sugar phosphate isomerase/epimerase [Planctomycetaceae bacterium]|nr:sugar phosphate isomerase/epimerase [Planctomycetaceae bacterium]
MGDLVVGLSTGCFFRTSIFDCLEQIRLAGFAVIEVCSVSTHLDYHDTRAVVEARRRMDGLGIEAYSFHAPFAEPIDITSLELHRRNTAIAELRRAVDAAAALGVRCMVVHPGPERGGFPETDRPRRMHNALSALSDVAEACRDRGMRLVLENMLPHLFLGASSDLLRLVDAVAEKDVGVCLDTGHAFLAGDLLVTTRKTGDHLRMVHAHDNQGQYDDHLPPGDGRIPWSAWWREAKSIGFRGPIILEIAGRSEANAVLADAIRGAQYMRALVDERPPSAK